MSDASTATTSATPADDVLRRRVGRELLAEAEAITALLSCDTAALGSNEVQFLSRLRDALISRAAELGNIGAPAAPPPTAYRPADTGSPAMAPSDPKPTDDKSGGLDLARIVLVSYLMFLFALMGYLFAKSHLMRVDVTGDIVEMLKVFLLPLVMLVLGFAFGARR